MCPMAWAEHLKPHRVTAVFAGPPLRVFDQCRSDAFAAVLAVGDEHAELSDAMPHEVDVHRPDEHAVDLGQDQRASAKKAFDFLEIGPSALALPHARFGAVIDLVDQLRETPDAVGFEIRLDREPRRHVRWLLHATVTSGAR